MASKPSPSPDAAGNRTSLYPTGSARAIRAAVVYAIIASLWIYASDSLLSLFITDPALFSLFSLWKGISFVAVTTLILYHYIRSAFAAIPVGPPPDFREAGEIPFPKPSVILPVVAFLILAVTIIAGGYLVFYHYEGRIRSAVTEQLTVIARLKAEEIERWLAERRTDARIVADDPRFIDRVNRWLVRKNPDTTDTASIHSRIATLQRTGGYRGIYLFDREGRLRDLAGQNQQFGPPFPALIRQAMATGEILLNDLHRQTDNTDHHLEMGLVVPLFHRDGGATKNIGAVYLSIDPSFRLFPLIQTWPTPSPSAEILVVRREGNEVVFLNELRHRKNTALTVRFPVDAPRLPVAMAIRGKTGLVEGNDYRGVPVVAFVTRVNGTPWYLVAKVDSAEGFAPIRRQQRLVTTLILVFTAAAGSVIFLWWRQQQARTVAAYLRTDLERRSLAARFDNLARHANDIIILVDEKMRIVDANDRAVEAYGYSRGDFLALTIRDIRAPETYPDLEVHWQQSATPEGTVMETVHRRKDGRTFPVEVSARTIEIGGQKFRQSIIRDISERKLAEEELRLSERNYRALSEQFNTLLDALPDAIFLISPEKRIIWANKAAAGLVGGDPIRIPGTFCFSSLHSRETPCEPCPAGRALVTCSQEEGHIRTGAGRHYELRGVPVLDGSGGACNVIEIARDVTEHRRTEEQLRHAQKMEAVGTLAGGIAHDFNNILTAIIGFGSLLLMKMPADDPLRGNVDHILTAADRAAALTKGLLAYSRKDALDLRAIDLNDIIKSIDRFLSQVIGEDIELTVIPADAPLTVFGDASQIEQVLMNLATNARDAMPGGGSLLIGAKEALLDESFISFHGFGTAGRFALITVSDTGSGMDEATREHIFEPFFTTKELGKGTGLGLAIAYGIVKQHRGFINVYSEPGKGTTFRLYLPLTGFAPEAELRTAPLLTRGRGETILVVEDSGQIRELLRELLSEYGYRVIEAADGEEGVERFMERRAEIDLILMDVIMPRKNGKEAYDEIRAASPDVKALFMSGYTADVISRKGIDATGLDLVTKPVTPAALLARIREVLERQF